METEEKKIGETRGAFGLSLKAGKWFFINMVIQRILAFATFFIVARILYPEDFGIITLVLIVPNFLDLVTNLSFENALIRHKEDTRPYLDAAWTFGILRGTIITLLVFLFAPKIASFFDIEEAVNAIRLSGFIILIQYLSNVAQLYFFKDMDFRKILWRDLSNRLAYFFVTISLAFILKSYWALIIGLFAQYATSAIATYFLHSYRPKIRFNFKILKELLDYSVWVYGQNLLAQIIGNFEDILVGKLTGTSNLGLYGKAKSLAGGPITPLSSMISKISFPAFARIQDDREKISEGITKSFDLLFLISIPFVASVLLGGHKMVAIVLGERWMEIVSVFKILSVGISINVLTAVIAPLFNALGQPKISFKIDMVFSITFIASLIILTPKFGIEGAAWSLVIASLIIFFAAILFGKGLVNINFKKMIYSGLVSFSATIIASGFGSLFLKTKFFNDNLGFLVIISGLGVIYLLSVFIAGKYLGVGPAGTIVLAWRELTRKN